MRILGLTFVAQLFASSCAFSPAVRSPLRQPLGARRAPTIGSQLRSSSAALDVSPDKLKGRIHKWGAGWKASAQASRASFSSSGAAGKLAALGNVLIYYSLFVVYRAWRGFFIIIPAVFGEVQAKLQAGLIEAENELNADGEVLGGELSASQ